MGALHPRPPDWTEQYLDLLRRIAKSPRAARDLPRQVDLLIFERLTRRRHGPGSAVARTGLDGNDAGRLIRLVTAFLRGQANVAVVDKALTTPVEPAPDEHRERMPADEVDRQGRLAIANESQAQD